MCVLSKVGEFYQGVKLYLHGDIVVIDEDIFDSNTKARNRLKP